MIYIEAWSADRRVSHASGFVIKKTVFEQTHMGTSQGLAIHAEQIDKYFLVTSWQVVTGVNTSDSNVFPVAPIELRMAMLCSNNEEQEIVWLHTPLYSESLLPKWFEHQKGGQEVSLVVVPITPPDGALLTIIDLNLESPKPQVGEKVSVLGYPFDLDTASELNVAFSPMSTDAIVTDISNHDLDNSFYISPTVGSAMSGATAWLTNINEGSQNEDPQVSLAGVYSERKENGVVTGRVWRIGVVQELLEQPRQGSNPIHQVNETTEEHSLNISVSENDSIIHFTSSGETLLSILSFGFLYLDQVPNLL